METDEEVKELEENLKNIKYKPMTFMQRLGLLIVVLTIAIGGFYLTQWLL